MQAPIDRNHGGNKWAAACRQLFLPDSQETEIFSIFSILAPLLTGTNLWIIDPGLALAGFVLAGFFNLSQPNEQCRIHPLGYFMWTRTLSHPPDLFHQANSSALFELSSVLICIVMKVFSWIIFLNKNCPDNVSVYRNMRQNRKMKAPAVTVHKNLLRAYVKCSTLHSRKSRKSDESFYGIVNLMNWPRIVLSTNCP